MADERRRANTTGGHSGGKRSGTTGVGISNSGPSGTTGDTLPPHNPVIHSFSLPPPPPLYRHGNERLTFVVTDEDTNLKEDSSAAAQQLTFLDKFRLRNSPRYFLKKPTGHKSRSLLSSPTKPGSHAEFSPYGTSPGANSEILFPDFTNSSRAPASSSDDSRRKSKKWYSFTNLLSRSSLRGFLGPRSRLSLSSIFTSDSDDVTPTTELPDFGFPGCSHHSVVPASPSPSCATVSGEFPSRGVGGSGTSIVFRRPRYGPRSYSVSASPAAGCGRVTFEEGVGGHESGTLSRESSYKNRNRGHRVSCGDFYPLPAPGPISPGFLGLDFQFHSYNRNGPGTGKFDGVGQLPKRTLGRSLPTLLEAMESSKLEGTGESPSSCSDGTSPPITVDTVAQLLYQEFVILTGSKTLDDHYLLIFPDRGNFHQLGDEEYKRLVKYLISIPPMQDAESGFVLIIDRRNDKWNSVKTTLLRISGYFPGLIHRVFVLRPIGFLQKALSEVSSKLFRNENLRFRLTVCNHVFDLLSFIDEGQLTVELGGTLSYDKIEWVQERVEVESFHAALQNLSRDLKSFTESFREMEYPNDVSSTEGVIQNKTMEFSYLKSDLSKAGGHGEKILKRIKKQEGGNGQVDPGTTTSSSSVQLVNVVLLQRFILQIDETGNLFQEFWDKERSGLERCLVLRRFEHNFKELQTSFDLHVKSLNGIPEMGDSGRETEEIILETVNYQDMTKSDLSRALQLESIGREIVSTNPSAVDTVEPKCLELSRMASHFRFILQEKLAKQKQWREVQSTIEKANELCTEGLDLLNSQQLTESTEENPDWPNMKCAVDKMGSKIQGQVDELVALKLSLTLATVTQAKTLVKQILRRVEEVQGLVAKRQSILLVQLERKPSISGSFFKSRRASGSFFDSKSISSRGYAQEDTSDGSSMSSMTKNSLSSTNSSDGSLVNGKSTEEEQERQVKRFHVLQELLQTEQTYVEEIGLILTGYRNQVNYEGAGVLAPPQLVHPTDKTKVGPNVGVLFCNLDEIFAFHSKIFLPDLATCLESIELVALCFIQRHSDFLAMYSDYCQLKSASDALLKEIGETHPWFTWCQEKLGHRLSLSSYLLKPVQRITKYHLLLGNLVKYSEFCDGYGELLEALDCMVVVVRSVNDGMHQLQIRGYPAKLSSEGPLLLQGQFTVWIETAKNRLRLKAHQRYLFLYHKSILVCKKTGQQSSLCYEFKNKINLSEVGITEDPKGSGASKKFEIWVQGRQKVFLFQASSREVKVVWVNEIKKLLMEQLQYLRESKGSTSGPFSEGLSTSSANGKRVRRLGKVHTLNGYLTTSQASSAHLPTRQSSYDQPDSRPKSRASGLETDGEDDIWSSGISGSEDEESSVCSHILSIPRNGDKSGSLKRGISGGSESPFYGIGESVENGPKFVASTKYEPLDPTLEIPLTVGEIVVLVKTGCAGWWFVRNKDGAEGWAPKGYLEKCTKSFLRTSASSQNVSAEESSVPHYLSASKNGGGATSNFQYEASVILQMCNELGSSKEPPL